MEARIVDRARLDQLLEALDGAVSKGSGKSPCYEAQAMELRNRWSQLQEKPEVLPGDLVVEKEDFCQVKPEMREEKDFLYLYAGPFDKDNELHMILVSDWASHGLPFDPSFDCIVIACNRGTMQWRPHSLGMLRKISDEEITERSRR